MRTTYFHQTYIGLDIQTNTMTTSNYAILKSEERYMYRIRKPSTNINPPSGAQTIQQNK